MGKTREEKKGLNGVMQKSVLVTGASTGIGWATSLELSNRGWRVFATVRKEADAKELIEASSGKITPVIMDIVDYESVKQGALEIENALTGAGLDALFNNAGISVQGPAEIVPIEMFEKQFQVNVFGNLFVTQTFLPLIRKAQGTIVFMSSESGQVTLPLMAPYSGSKFAIEAVASALRKELLPSKIRVSLVEAATIKTPMWDKVDTTTNKFLQCLSKKEKELYAAELDTLIYFPKKQATMGMPMKKVVKVILRALNARRPKPRYVVGWEAWALIILHKFFPTIIVDWVSSKLVRQLGTWLKPK
ncbi:MAG: SDR family oxidoreductase [Proteobacteria bacterium]|nr:SDR family oxidoreductase [Pseudomonadota bacterium]